MGDLARPVPPIAVAMTEVAPDIYKQMVYL